MNAPVPSTSTYHRDDTPTQEDEEKDIARRAALEFLVSLTEGRPPMVVACAGWVPAVVKCCLEGMAEIRELHPTGPDSWLETDDVGLSLCSSGTYGF